MTTQEMLLLYTNGNADEAIRLLDSWHTVFGSPDGQRVLEHLASLCFVTRPIEPSEYEHLMTQQIGMQLVYHIIVDILNEDLKKEEV